MMLPKRNGPIVKSPSIPPTTARPHAFRFTATIPPVRVKTERIHPMMPQVVRSDWSCSAVIGASAGKTLSIIDDSSAIADDQVNNPSNPAMIKKIPAISGMLLGFCCPFF